MNEKRHKDNQGQEDTKYHGKPACHGDIKWPSVYPVRIEPTAGEEKRYAEQYQQARNQLNAAKTLNVITACAAAVGLFGLLYLHGQLGAMLESNRTNHEALVSVQRAFVFYTDMQTENIQSPDGKKLIQFIPKWENSGSTPAMSVVSYFETDVIPAASLAAYPFMENGVSNRQLGVLGPKAIALSGTRNMLESEVFETPPDKTVILWGWKAYRDIFQGTAPHVTEFCDMVNSRMAVLKPGKLIPVGQPVPYQITLITCPRHNCADEECEDYKRISAYTQH